MPPENASLDNFIPHDYPTFKLSDEEIEDPFLTIEDFFSFGHLPDIRQMMWEWYKSTVTGTFPRDLERRERKEITHLFEYLERLIEATHLLNQRRLMEEWKNRGKS